MTPRSRRRRQGAQSLVETALVLPIVMLVTLGGIMFLIWQLDINSAQFGSEVGIQLADIPTNAQNSGNSTGLMCRVAYRTYNAITTQSFLGGTPLAQVASGSGRIQTCAASAGIGSAQLVSTAGTVSTGTVQYECPPVGTVPDLTNMRTLLDSVAQYKTSKNVMIICPYSTTSGAGPTAELTVKVVVVGYKASQVPSALLGNIPFYGQATETVQEFTSS